MKKFVFKILVRFNFLAIVLLILCYLSVFVHPRYFWPLQFGGTIYPIVFIINVGFVILWAVKKRKLLLYSLVALAIGFTFIGRYVQLYRPSFSDNAANNNYNTFKIISFNIRLFNLYKWVKSDNTASEILGFIKTESPNLLCLQEFYTKDRGNISEKAIIDSFGDTIYSHISYKVRKQGVSNFGIATFSRFPIVNKGEILFPNTFNQCIYTDISFFGDTLRIYNVHLQSYRFLKEDYRTIDSLRFKYSSRQMKGLKGIYYRVKTTIEKRAFQADTLSQHIKTSPYPVIICGDFNDSPISYTYQKISKNMKDAFRESGSGIGNTYFWKFPFYRIDYILHDNNYKAFNYRSPKTKFSDHYPVICEISGNPKK